MNMFIISVLQNQNQTPDKTMTAVPATCSHKVSYYLSLFGFVIQGCVV